MRGIRMTNGEDKTNVESEIGEKVAQEQVKEVTCKVDFAKDNSSVTIFLVLKNPADMRNAVYVLERLKFDFLDAMKLNEMNQRIAKQNKRDILQAKDPMGTNARKDPSFWKKHFAH